MTLLAGITVTRRRYQAADGDPELVDRILLPAILLGFVGARAGYVLTHTDRFAGRWLDVFAVWNGGLVLFGGLTVGTLTAVWLARRHGADLGALAGAAAIGVPLAQALGRPADYFSQELFGTPSSLPWAVEIPERLRPAAYLDAATFHPAFLYEALWSLATVGVLLALERRGTLRRERLLFGYFMAYGVGRFALELIRTDTTFRLLGISRNGWIAAALMIGGTTALVATRTRHRTQIADPTPPLVGADRR